MFDLSTPRRLLLVAAVVAGAATASSVAAQTLPGDPVSVTVKVGDLDLGGDDGARIALRRIRAAAEWVCGEAPYAFDLPRYALYRNCVSGAVKAAVETLAAPRVTALVGGAHRTGQLAARR